VLFDEVVMGEVDQTVNSSRAGSEDWAAGVSRGDSEGMVDNADSWSLRGAAVADNCAGQPQAPRLEEVGCTL
jgi:hypothetical protein